MSHGLKSLLPLWEKGFRDEGKKFISQLGGSQSAIDKVNHGILESRGAGYGFTLQTPVNQGGKPGLKAEGLAKLSQWKHGDLL
jgi:hypothetical protein